MGALEREIDLLERELEDVRLDPDLYPDQKATRTREIMQALRDIERDAAEQEQWRDEGRERGWA